MSESPAARASTIAPGGSVLVTATMRTDAGSRPAPRAASSTARRTSARRAASSSSKETRLLEQPLHLVERQADHVGERALDLLDQPGSETLDGIGARLVVALAAGDVARHRPRIQGTEA